MKQQYLGDINDFRKYCILRHLARHDFRIGVCWLLTPDDGGGDGKKIHYLREPKRCRDLDRELFDLLAEVILSDDRKPLEHLEEKQLIPGALYFNRLTRDDRGDREAFFADAMQNLAAADIIFFDPDNGIEVKSRPKGRKHSSKYLFWDEIETAARNGYSLLIYQHFPREERRTFIERISRRLRQTTGVSSIWVVETGHVVFFAVPSEAHAHRLSHAMSDLDSRYPFASTRCLR